MFFIAFAFSLNFNYFYYLTTRFWKRKYIFLLLGKTYSVNKALEHDKIQMDRQLNRQHNYSEQHGVRQNILHFGRRHLYKDLDTFHSCRPYYSDNQSSFHIEVYNMAVYPDNQANKHTMDYYS